MYGAYIYTEKGFIKIYFCDLGEDTLVKIKRFYNGKMPVSQEFVLSGSAENFKGKSICFRDGAVWKKALIRPVRKFKVYYNQ